MNIQIVVHLVIFFCNVINCKNTALICNLFLMITKMHFKRYYNLDIYLVNIGLKVVQKNLPISNFILVFLFYVSRKIYIFSI